MIEFFKKLLESRYVSLLEGEFVRLRCAESRENILGACVAFQGSTNQAGAWFRLQKFIPPVRTDPRAPVRGLN